MLFWKQSFQTGTNASQELMLFMLYNLQKHVPWLSCTAWIYSRTDDVCSRKVWHRNTLGKIACISEQEVTDVWQKQSSRSDEDLSNHVTHRTQTNLQQTKHNCTRLNLWTKMSLRSTIIYPSPCKLQENKYSIKHSVGKRSRVHYQDCAQILTTGQHAELFRSPNCPKSSVLTRPFLPTCLAHHNHLSLNYWVRENWQLQSLLHLTVKSILARVLTRHDKITIQIEPYIKTCQAGTTLVTYVGHC